MTRCSDDALSGLCRFIQLSLGADLVVALEVEASGNAISAASCPSQVEGRFNLAESGIYQCVWTSKPQAASAFRLPTSLCHALGAKPSHLLFVSAPLFHAPDSGLLLLWKHGLAAITSTDHVMLMAESIATLMTAKCASDSEAATRNQFADLFESVPSGIVLYDGDGRSAMINERAAALLGCSAGAHQAADLAKPMRSLRERCDNAVQLQHAYSALMRDVNFAASLHWVLGERTLEVDTHPVRGGGKQGRIWLFTDVTAELRMSAELQRLATFDALTGVPNRRHFEERFAQIIAAREASGRSISILMIDVDRFKQINDTHGHPAGDEVLKVVARRCREALREGDLLARFGGEEFIVLLTDPHAREVDLVTERLRRVISDVPIAIDKLAIAVSVSIGAVTATDRDGDENLLQTLISRADSALYCAKRDGRNCVRIDA